VNSYPQFADARRTGTVRRPRCSHRQVTIRQHHRLPERELGSSRPATIVAAAAQLAFLVAGALLTVSVVLCAQAALRSTSTIAIRTAVRQSILGPNRQPQRAHRMECDVLVR